MKKSTFDRVMQMRRRTQLWTEASHLEEQEDALSNRKAFRLLREAVHQGERDTLGVLANAYDAGRGVRPSRRMAVHFYRRAWRSGSSLGAQNLAVTLRQEGRLTSAERWFRRAIAGGNPDARFDLAKLLLKNPPSRAKAQRLLEEYVAAGAQELYAVRPIGELPRVDMSAPIEDDDHEEAKKLLQELKGSVSV